MKPAGPAFCSNAVQLSATGSGALNGLRLAVKDVFDVAGHITGCGSPDWQRTHAPAGATASTISRLLAAGATLVGKTVTDELAYSLNGENHHYGTPANPRAPGRIPGGSSSGSASAVAADLADIAIGTDCGGSVRIPASFCGLYGMRPTHGRIAADGLIPLAADFDTVGWFAASADNLRRVGTVLLGEDAVPVSIPVPAAAGAAAPAPRTCTLFIARDFLARIGAAERAALQPALARLQACFANVVEIDIGNPDPDELMLAFRTLQGAQIWATHGAWITHAAPTFGPGVRERFAAAAEIGPDQVRAAQQVRDHLTERIGALLADGSMLCLPSAPGIAPLRKTSVAGMEQFRGNAMRMLCIAGLTGVPQVSVPVTEVEACPLGLSLMMAAGADRALLDFVVDHDVRDRAGAAQGINLPEVLAEVEAAFARYEHALTHNEVPVLDHLFWDSERTVRYGAAENLVGVEQIRAFRQARPSAGLMRTLQQTVITTFGRDAATACTQFTRTGDARIGRQTQTWIRTAGGWKVVAAHVSLMLPS